jgi:hypothetical protein
MRGDPPLSDIVGELVVRAWDLKMFTLNAGMFSDFANNILMLSYHIIILEMKNVKN